MVEEDVDELPEQVVGDLCQLLGDEAIVGGRLERTRCPRRSMVRSAVRSEIDHVVRLAQKPQPLARQGERRERPLAHDHRMDELDRDVVGIRPGLRRAPEGEQPPSADEPLGHHAARRASGSAWASKYASPARVRDSRS